MPDAPVLAVKAKPALVPDTLEARIARRIGPGRSISEWWRWVRKRPPKDRGRP